jgi:hypothetical protein
MACDDFHARFVKRNIEQFGRFSRHATTSAHTRAGSASISIPIIPVFGIAAAAPTTRPAWVPALPVQCTMAAGRKSNCAACGSISEIVVA